MKVNVFSFEAPIYIYIYSHKNFGDCNVRDTSINHIGHHLNNEIVENNNNLTIVLNKTDMERKHETIKRKTVMYVVPESKYNNKNPRNEQANNSEISTTHQNGRTNSS